jgi:outer membrane protein TolC
LHDTELRAKAGLVGPSEVANARTFLAEQELILIDRSEEVDRLSDDLSSLMGTRPAERKPRFVTLDEPPREFPIVPVDTLVVHAMKGNLELQAADEDIEGARALADAATWEALPSVDLVGSIGGNGLSGRPQDVIFGDDTLRSTRSGDFSDALRQSLKREFPSWSIGVEISIPIGLRSGLGEQERLEAELMSAEQRRLERARTIEEQVRSSYRELVHGQRRLGVAREGVDAAQEQVRIGQIEFENGRATAFELVRLGADFALAQLRYSEALVRTAKAAASLRQLTSGSYPDSFSP